MNSTSDVFFFWAWLHPVQTFPWICVGNSESHSVLCVEAHFVVGRLDNMTMQGQLDTVIMPLYSFFEDILPRTSSILQLILLHDFRLRWSPR